VVDALGVERLREDAMRSGRPEPAIAARRALRHDAREADGAVVPAARDPRELGPLLRHRGVVDLGQRFRIG
jgi:hypothetical protein